MVSAESSNSPTGLGGDLAEKSPMAFDAHYQGLMRMYAPLDEVADYLHRHHDWFHRCAQPMRVEPLSTNGYVLTIGQFGNFGYEIEPKLAVVFDPPNDNVYRMYNVPLPDGQSQSYMIDYDASMELKSLAWQQVLNSDPQTRTQFGDRLMPDWITQVNWELHLQVLVQFPNFMYKLPQRLLKSTGDRLLASIIAQISPRLTTKVQQDFHQRLNLPLPLKSARSCMKLNRLGSVQTDSTRKDSNDATPPEQLAWNLPTDSQ